MKSRKQFLSVKDTTIPFVEFVRRYSSETKARRCLVRMRWGSRVTCPHCGHDHVWNVRRGGVGGYYECPKCRRVFTVRTGTVFERSHVPLTKWLYAIYKVIASRKGISSVQLAVEIGVTQKTAWFMLQRGRQSCAQTFGGGTLRGIVEADAAYFGGRERCRHESKRLRLGRGAVGKIAVLGARERGGRTFAKVIPDTGAGTVHGTLSGMVSGDSSLMTDEHRSYVGAPFAEHMVVRHGAAEFVRGMAHTNGIESVWSVLKRGWVGVYHHFSRKHLQLYVNEFCFRLNEGDCRRRLEDRIADLCGFSFGTGHMTYRELVSGEGDGGLLRAA